MLLLLLFNLFIPAGHAAFYVMEDGEIRLPVECLPKSVKENVNKKDEPVLVEKSYQLSGKEELQKTERRSMKLSNEKEIAKSCDLEGLQAFFDGRFYSLNGGMNIKYIVSEKNECNYSVPRVQVVFWNNPFQNAFLLGPEYSVLDGEPRKLAEASFNRFKRNDVHYGNPRAYFSHAKDKTSVYIVSDHTEMGTKLILYRLQEKKLTEVSTAAFEPCGS